MKMNFRRFWAMLLTVVMMVGIIPVSDLAVALAEPISSNEVQGTSGQVSDSGNVTIDVTKIWVNTSEEDRKSVTMSFGVTYGVAGVDDKTDNVNYVISGFNSAAEVTETFSFPRVVNGLAFSQLAFTGEDGTAIKTLRVTPSNLNAADVNGETEITVYNTVTKSVTVTKNWPEGDGDKHSNVTVRLVCDQNAELYFEIKLEKVAGTNTWSSGTFTNVPMADMGGAGNTPRALTYHVEETQIDGDSGKLADYQTTISGNVKSGFIVSNVSKITTDEKIRLRINKHWDDTRNPTTKGASRFIIKCLNDPTFEEYPIELRRGTNLSDAVGSVQLDKYVTGSNPKVERLYTVEEYDLSGAFVAQTPVVTSANGEIIWSFNNLVKTISLMATKSWLGGTPAEGTIVKLQLYRNGQPYTDDNGQPVYCEISYPNLTHTFSANWPRFDENGNEYVYSVKEVSVTLPQGEQGYTYRAIENGMHVTNVREEADGGSGAYLVITKQWDSAGYAYTKFPGVKLVLKDGSEIIWERTTDESTSRSQTFVLTSADLKAGKTLEYNKPYTLEEIDEQGNVKSWKISISNDGTINWIEGSNIGYGIVTNTLVGDLEDEPEEEFTNLFISKKWELNKYSGLNVNDLAATFRLATQNGTLPDSITVVTGTANSYQNGVVTINGNNYVVLRVPTKDANGNRYVYTVSETAIPQGFTCVSTATWLNGYEFVNKQDDVVYTAKKIWAGLKEREGGMLGLPSIRLTLERSIKGANNFKAIASAPYATYNALDSDHAESPLKIFDAYPTYGYENGQWVEYEYRVVESSDSDEWGMFQQGEPSIVNGREYTFTNTYNKDQAKINLLVQKIWEQGIPGVDYPVVTVGLYEGGNEYLNGATHWTQDITVSNGSGTALFSGLPKYKLSGGQLVECQYQVKELSLTWKGETKTLGSDGKVTFTYTYTDEFDQTTRTIDYDCQYNGTKLLSETLTSLVYQLSNSMTIAPKDKRFALIVRKDWTTEETLFPDVKFEIQRSKDNTNWEPVYSNIELSKTKGWTKTFEDVELLYTEGGTLKAYSFRLVEINPPTGYIAILSQPFTIDNTNLEDIRTTGAIINKPAADYKVNIVKVFDDGTITFTDAMKEQLRGAKLSVKLVSGSMTFTVELSYDEATGNFLGSVNLPAQAPSSDGTSVVPLKYTVTELSTNVASQYYDFSGIVGTEGFITKKSDGEFEFVIGELSTSGAATLTIKNTLKDKVSIYGEKEWDDAGFEAYRPDSITVEVQRKLSGAQDSTFAGFGKTITVNAPWTFSAENLDMYDANGNLYVYRFIENVPVGYTGTVQVIPAYFTDGAAKAGTHLKNTIKPASVTVNKTWITDLLDSANATTGFGLKPASIAVTLMRRNPVTGEDIEIDSTKSISTTGAGADTLTYTNLPTHDKNGNAFEYYVVETDALNGYTKADGSLALINTIKLKDITVTKKWENAQRPSTITLTLTGVANNKTVYLRTVNNVTGAADGDWSYTFANLPLYHYEGTAEHLITYYVTETAPGYEMYLADGETAAGANGAQVTGTAVTIVNKLKKKAITLTKAWENDNDYEGLRPGSVAVKLYRIDNDTKEPVFQGDYTINAPKWTLEISGLDENDGKNRPYTYYIEEVGDPGLGLAYTVSQTNPKGLTVTNTLKTISLKLEKKWEKDTGLDVKPLNVKFKVTGTTADGNVVVTIDEVTLTGNAWSETINGLPMYGKNKAGNYGLVTYTVEEKNPNGSYAVSGTAVASPEAGSATIYAAAITNTYNPLTIEIEKQWDEKEDVVGGVANAYQRRPMNVIIDLYRQVGNDTATKFRVDTATLIRGGAQSATFTNLPSHNKTGEAYTYFVEERELTGYGTPIITQVKAGQKVTFTVTNKLPLGQITVNKAWTGDEKFTRPATFTIALVGKAGGATVMTQVHTFNAAQGERLADVLSHTFTGLPLYHYTDTAALEIFYTVTETGANGYVLSAADGDNNPVTVTDNSTLAVETGKTYSLTNALKTKLLQGEKTWNTFGRDDVMPGQITIKLMRRSASLAQDETVVDSYPVTKGSDGKWTWKFENYPELDGSNNPYTYWVEETVPLGYTVSQGKSMDLTNTLKTTKVSVEKKWYVEDDESCPGTLAITLTGKAGSSYEKDYPYTLTAAGQWKHTFENLPRYAYVDGTFELITYTIEETVPNGYTELYTQPGEPKTEGNYEALIENSIVPAHVKVTKAWDKDEYIRSLEQGAYDTRPDQVTIRLYRTTESSTEEPKEIASEEILRSNEAQTITFNNLQPTAANGEAYIFSITEDQVPGYATVIEGDQTAGFTVTNTLDLTKVEGKKVWANYDVNNKYVRPTAITLVLTRASNGAPDTEFAIERVINTPVGNEAEWGFYDLPAKDTAGNLYTYSVEETPLTAYATTYNGTTITNTLKTMKIHLTKQWEDMAKDKQPATLEVTLTGTAGEAVCYEKTIALEKANSWKYTFDNLPIYDADGNLIQYVVSEQAAAYYILVEELSDTNVTYDGKAEYDLLLYNRVDTETIQGSKKWVDDGNPYDTRPDSIFITLHRSWQEGKYSEPVGAPVEISYDKVKGGWFWNFGKLDKYVKDTSQAYTYYVTEEKVPGYVTTVDEENPMNLVNTLETVDVRVDKSWLGEGTYEDGQRPEKLVIKLTCHNDASFKALEYDLTADENWGHTFTALPKYVKNTNTLAIYTVNEVVPANYDGTKATDFTSEESYELTLKNTLRLTSVKVSKVWDDQDNGYQTRPHMITFNLMQDSQWFDKVDLLAEDGVAHEFDNLLMYDKAGHKHVYTVEEVPVLGYTTQTDSEDGIFTITNTLEVVDVKITKEWLGEESHGISQRPETLKVALTSDDPSFKEQTWDLAASSNWSHTFENLPKYIANTDTEAVYTVRETTVANYKAISDSDTGSYELKLSNELLLTSIKVQKTWEDQDNKYKTRPEKITFNLLRDGSNYLSETLEVTGDEMSFTFEELLVIDKETGKPYTYNVTESPVAGYKDAAIEETADGYSITNTLDVTEVEVLKIWDGEAHYGDTQRPEQLELTLASSDPAFETQHYQLKPDENGDWAHTFTGLPKYEVGSDKFAEYTVTEAVLGNFQGAEARIPGSAKRIFINTLELTSVTIEKHWEDENNRYFTRPEKLIFTLLRDGITNDTVTLNVKDELKYTFEDLLKYDKDDGHEYEYTVTEAHVNGYLEAKIEAVKGGFTFTNTLDTVALAGEKTWADSNNMHGTRPESITVTVIRSVDGENWETVPGADTLKVSAPWTWAFKGLPAKDAKDQPYAYAAYEQADPRYKVSYTGNALNNLTNTLETIVLRVEKVWQDEGNEAQRPSTLGIKLVSSTGKTYLGTLVERAGKWYAEYALPKYDANGQQVTYTLSETPPAGYQLVSISDWELDSTAARETYKAVITNKLVTTSVTVNKVWHGATRASVTVQLLANGSQIKQQTFGRPWTYTFENLPMYDKEGSLITYTVTETRPANFRTSYERVENGDGSVTVTVTNTYVPREEPPTEEPTPTPETPTFPPNKKTTNIFTITEDDIPLGAGINLNLGDCFD